MPNFPELSVVVPATDGPRSLERCLDAIRRSDETPNDVVVVEDAASLGPAAARNAGFARCRGEIVVFVDADVEVGPDAFTRIRETFERDPSLAAVFGSYDDAPADPGVVSQFRNLLHHHVHHASPGPARTFWAGLGAVRREALEAIGGFDQARFRSASVEDIDFGLRLARSGLTLRLDPAIQGKHLKRWSLASMVATDLSRRAIPWLRLELQARSGSTALNLGWRHRLSALASLAVVASVVALRPLGALIAVAALVLLNHSLYSLLARRLGAARASLAVALHVLHHLTAIVALPAAMLGHLAAGRRRGARSSPLVRSPHPPRNVSGAAPEPPALAARAVP